MKLSTGNRCAFRPMRRQVSIRESATFRREGLAGQLAQLSWMPSGQSGNQRVADEGAVTVDRPAGFDHE
jgi:hypothetical protein